jgi:deoxyribodipyrimidine photolyase
MDISYWKKRFLYPFANISPLPDTELDEALNQFIPIQDRNFNKLVSLKYSFPLHSIKDKQAWLQEIQSPLTVTAEEIHRDLLKFIKDFPVEIIPHMNEEEISAYVKMGSSKAMRSPLRRDHTVEHSSQFLSESYDIKKQSSGVYTTSLANLDTSPNVKDIKIRMLNPLHFDKH